MVDSHLIGRRQQIDQKSIREINLIKYRIFFRMNRDEHYQGNQPTPPYTILPRLFGPLGTGLEKK